MVELYYPIAGENLSYEGYFSMSDVFKILDKYYRTKGFDKKIVFDEEYDGDNGKYIHVKTEYYKKTDTYVRLQSRLWIYANDLIEVETEVDGKKVLTNHGRLSITFDGHIQTEYFNRFDDTKPFYFMFKVLYEKYIAKDRIKYWEEVLRHITDELKAEISGYLNLKKFLYEK